ncbi:hypothetical protein AB0O57_29555 [Streptomyces sp. NPDC091201]|uniref:hypothetical protein n=1 Tax=Streptomyces sp. NPDC091201 TaxID=3155190 RepID=UPI0034479839
MMPHARARCQPDPTARRQIDIVTTRPDVPRTAGFAVVSEHAQQWISRTNSRRIRTRREWMRAVRWMVAAGVRAGANGTTIRVAQDIAGRMGRSKHGHVAYCLDGMVRRLQLSRRAVTLHVAILRELGLLVWVEQGSSRRNALRTRRGADFRIGDGFARTATIYAPVAPRVWDDAMGRRIGGDGYQAYVLGVQGERGRALAVSEAREDQVLIPGQRPAEGDVQEVLVGEGEPVDNQSSCTPSVQLPKPRRTSTVDGGNNYRPRKRAARSEEVQGSRKAGRGQGSTGWSAQRTAWAMSQARFVQLNVWWTQGSCVRQLAFALRPLFEGGWGWEECARELARWAPHMRPRHVASYVTSEVRRRVNQAVLDLPEGLVAPYRQAPADEEGQRHRALYDAWRAYADRRTQETAALRGHVRSLTPRSSVGRRMRVPRGMEDARPENVLLSSGEIQALTAAYPPIRSNEELWAEVEEKAAERLLREEALWAERRRAPGVRL